MVIDRPLDMSTVSVLGYSVSSPGTELESVVVAAAAKAGLELVRLRDLPGLVVARVVAMLINEASEVVHLGLCSAAEVDTAMKLGTNYPLGLLQWGDRWTSRYVASLVDTLAQSYLDPRYRTSLVLRRTALDPGARLVETVRG
jgi:3-hydroxybutyryl-CoA dehydrogenase